MGNYVWKARSRPGVPYLTNNSCTTDQSDEEDYESCTENGSLFSELPAFKTAIQKVARIDDKTYSADNVPESSDAIHCLTIGENHLSEKQLSEKITIEEFLSSELDEYTQSEDLSEISLEEFSNQNQNLEAFEPHLQENTTQKTAKYNSLDLHAGGDLPNNKLMSVNEFIKFENQTEIRRESVAWEINYDDATKNPPENFLKKSKALPSNSPQKQQVLNRPSIDCIDVATCKVLDLRRWYCISRPQYKKSCGISSVVSVWNYLFSSLGTGKLPPITQEKALHLLGFEQPFEDIRFGPFTGNATLMRWFRKLSAYHGVQGKAFYMYKPKGRMQTKLMTDFSALDHLKKGLASENTAFIYHCLNHYFCPIGFELTPQNPTDAYTRKCDNGQPLSVDSTDVLPTTKSYETWIFIGEPSKKHPPIHCKRWSEILQDLQMEGPAFFDIRQPHKGIQQRKTKKRGGNLHCLIAFTKSNQTNR